MLADRLKTDTRAAHADAEASPSMRALMAPDVSPAAYREHLAGVARFVVPLERRLAAAGLDAVVPDLDARLVKAAWLRQDLDALGDAAALPGADGGEPLGTAEALGALYVVEGSTLGGRLIERHLARALGVTPETGARYYHAYGEARGARWPAFRVALDAFGAARPADAGAVVAGADAAFRAFGQALRSVAA